jgi:ABC-type molybdate transport system substrate-binding protein
VRKLFAILVTFPLFNTAAADLHVFAAASLTNALREITAGFETESGLRATLNSGGSSLLARQIEEGASDDVFVSADEAKMDQLQKNGLVVVATDSVRTTLAAVEAVNATLVYQTDAAISKRVRVIYGAPVKETPGIRYPVAILRETKRRAGAERFARYLGSSEAHGIFVRHGFVVQR